MLRTARIQVQLLAIALYNIILNLLPFYRLKRLYLNATGSSLAAGAVMHIPVYVTRPGRLQIGTNTTVNFGCYLDTRGVISIGANVMIGHKCRIYTAGHRIRSDAFEGFHRTVTIADDAVLFPNSIILPGVTIGRGAVVLPGTVVKDPVEPFAIVGGNPARLVGTRPNTIRYALGYDYWFTNS